MNNPTYASASLYVGDLSPEVTETQLFEIFKQVGPVASIRVCRDAITRRSLGYAYVNYHNLQDAERAIDLMNFSDIKGKQCRIMWSQRDPQMRKSGVGNLFVKNVDKKVDNKTFYDLFSSYGNILSCKIATDEHGNSKGFGFVHFETNEAAEKAIADLNGKDMWGKKLFVGLFIKDRKVDEETKKKYTNVFIKNLSKTVSDEKLTEIFGKFGKITNCVVMKEEDGSSKGFGFVNFDTTEDAQKAVEELNGKDIEGQTIYAGRAQKKAERERELRDMFERIKRDRMSKYQGVNLYVKNLDESVDDEKLRQEFSVCGTITSTKIMRDDKGVSKGFGFVCYSTPEEATKAVTEMNGKMINDKQIYVALAQRKDLRRQHLEAQYAQRAAGIRLQQQAQATGVTGHPLYATGAPVFYGQRPGFVYQGQMMPRGRFAAPMQGFPPGYAAPQQQRSQRGRSNKGGRGGHVGGRKQGGYTGIKYNPNVRNQPAAQAPAPAQPAVPAQPIATPEMSVNEIGEKLFNLISASHDASLAGKITGMLLDAYNLQELVGFLNSKDVLAKKVSEAIEVLDVYAHEQKSEATN